MDQSAVSYFVQKFGSYDAEELGELVSRRADLSDEAIEALSQVLAQKGLHDSDVYAPPLDKSARTPDEERARVEDETKSARELWRGGLSTTCKFLVALAFIAPVQVALKSVNIGALWAGLTVFVAGCVGYRVGHAITRNICANAEVPLEAKKKRLWIMFTMLWPIYFVVYVVSFVVFGRG